MEDARKQAEEAEKKLMLAKQKVEELDLSVKEGLNLLGIKEHTDLPSLNQYTSMKSSLESLRTLLVKQDTLVDSKTDCQNAWDLAEKPNDMDSSEGILALLDNDTELKLTKIVEDYKAERAINDAELDTDGVKEAEGKSLVDVSKDKDNLKIEMDLFNIEKRKHVVAKARLTDLKTSSATLAEVKDEYTNFASKYQIYNGSMNILRCEQRWKHANGHRSMDSSTLV